jgi:hypothetical protein
VHLVIATRADPPLSRLRVRGELVEIRAADLRFTPDEAAAYLNGTMGLDLTGADVAVWRDGRKAGSPRSSLPRLSLQGDPTPPRSSPNSPATTDTSLTTSPTRCSPANPRTSDPSCSERQSSID